MTVGKKMNRIGGQHVVEINAGIRKLAKDRRGKAVPRSDETAGALTLPLIRCSTITPLAHSMPGVGVVHHIIRASALRK